MPELPFHLKTIEPVTGALDIIRYLGSISEPVADAYTISDSVGLSDRSFGKAIRRLVTKGYVAMDGDQVYRLTEQGHLAVEELAAYDETAPAQSKTSDEPEIRTTQRRLVLVAPRTLVAGQNAEVFVGFNAADGEEPLSMPADMVVRLALVNGEPTAPRDMNIQLDDDSASRSLNIRAGNFTQTRVRVQVFQLGPNPDDISVSGGMYVDLNVAADSARADTSLTAYGADVAVMSF